MIEAGARHGFGGMQLQPRASGFGCAGGPAGSRCGGGFAGNSCAPWDDFFLDSSRLEWAGTYYLNKWKTPMPQRVANIVSQKGYCTKASLTGQLDGLPPQAGDVQSADASPPPPPPGAGYIPPGLPGGVAGPGAMFGPPLPPPAKPGMSKNMQLGIAAACGVAVLAAIAYNLRS
jgi:hypothetical protein